MAREWFGCEKDVEKGAQLRWPATALNHIDWTTKFYFWIDYFNYVTCHNWFSMPPHCQRGPQDFDKVIAIFIVVSP